MENSSESAAKRLSNKVKDFAYALSKAKLIHKRVNNDLEQFYKKEIDAAEKKHQSQVSEFNKQKSQKSQENKDLYDKRARQVREYFSLLQDLYKHESASWIDSIWEEYATLKVGEYHVPSITRIGELKAGQFDSLHVPALLPIIGQTNLLIKSSGYQKDTANRSLQAITLRLLATLPVGKAKVLMIDPVQLGANMGGLLNLSPTLLEGGKIWSDVRHIESQLQAMSEHMETVIQSYLKNEFDTLEEYNQSAKELKEPYRLVVVSNFPHGFSEESARRLVSIAQNGRKTGVYVLVSIDLEQKLPYNFNLNDLERYATVLNAQLDYFVWKAPVFENYQVMLDVPPAQERFNRIIDLINKEAENIEKVEINLEDTNATRLPESDWWKQSSISVLKAPIGLQGNRKPLNFQFDLKTLAHCLIAGKTGSGKSTLLHTLIISLALNYSPDELELYLLDFKQVEFLSYAEYGLPHAKVVAAHGVREFGISVLQKVHSELLRRKTLFSSLRDLEEYRKTKKAPLPRILLLVDEFQNFFMPDDAMARQAHDLMVPLVREGRAFGIHLVLASQSLKGSASYIKGEISDQMSIRIALQCNDEDVSLIMGDENKAARLLNRPGEALYNDQGGAIQANTTFQVVKTDYKKYTQKLAKKAKDIGYAVDPIVFDGSKPADILSNLQLQELLRAKQTVSERKKVDYAWLGEPITIKNHTAASFRRQSRSNMLILGQNEETAIALMSSAFISLSLHYKQDEANFYIIDTTSPDAEWSDIADKLSQVSQENVKVAHGRREIEQIIADISTEVDTRNNLDHKSVKKPIYLFIIGLHKAKNLRKAEGFFGQEQAPTPSSQFINILKEGPEVQVHTISWCNTFSSLEKTIDRRYLEEFDLRVGLQMAENDSQSLLNSSLANKIGENRACLSDEDQASDIEVFRPYALPSDKWLNTVRKAIENKNKKNAKTRR